MILGTYNITYPGTTDVIQTKDLINHNDFINIISPTKKELVLLEIEYKEANDKKDLEKSKELFKQINYLNSLLKPFGKNYFTTKSPLGLALETGLLNLPILKNPILCSIIKVN